MGFRWFVREQARTLGIRGWVMNRGDGSVEVEAEGDAASLEALRRALARGPDGARVSSVDDLPTAETSGERPYPFSIAR